MKKETSAPKTLTKLFDQSQSFNQFKNSYLDHFVKILDQLQSVDFEPFVKKLIACQKNKKKLILIGNGGSAATANHLAMGISYVTHSWKEPIKALSLSADSVSLTSIANDWGYDHIFSKQLEIMMDPEDVLVCLSVSGSSPNILRAAQYAKERGNYVFGFTGSIDNPLSRSADTIFTVGNGELVHGFTEDAYMILGHALCYYIEFSVNNDLA